MAQTISFKYRRSFSHLHFLFYFFIDLHLTINYFYMVSEVSDSKFRAIAAMSLLRNPDPLCLEGNLAENWRSRSAGFDLFLTASGIDEKEEAVQAATFLHLIGPEARSIYDTFEFADPADRKKMTPLKQKFAAYCEPRKNITFLRHQFFTRTQAHGESFDQFLLDLKRKAKHCEFSALEESLIRDRIVAGVRNDSLRVRLLRDTTLDLKTAIEACRAAEARVTELHVLQRPPTAPAPPAAAEVHVIAHQQPAPPHRDRDRNTGQPQHFRSARPPVAAVPRPEPVHQQVSPALAPCHYCGLLQHPASGVCPARGNYCGSCGKKNHFASACRSRPMSTAHTGVYKRPAAAHVRHLETIEHQSESSPAYSSPQLEHAYYSDSLFIGTLNKAAAPPNPWTVTLTVSSSKLPLRVHLDTGAQCNVLSEATFRSLAVSASLQPTSTRLVALGGENIRPIGIVTIPCSYRNVAFDILFYVIAQDAPSTLGIRSCQDLDLLRRVDTIEPSTQPLAPSPLDKDCVTARFLDRFSALGCLPGRHTIRISDTAQPVVHPPRRVPNALLDRVKAELQRLEQLDVIVKQDEPISWVNSMVLVVKPDKLRICLDPKDLNAAIQREHFPLPTIEAIVSRLPNAKFFSLLDANSGFWQIQLDEASSTLCTFNTPFGRYRFKCLPFGISSAPEVFQKAMTEHLEGLAGVECIIDDVLVWGTTSDEHDERLLALMHRARERNLNFNIKKA